MPGSPSPARTADLGRESAPAAPISHVPLVIVEEGKLTVDVHHAELESVLREIARGLPPRRHLGSLPPPGTPDASVGKEVIWALRRRGVLDP